MHKLILGLVLLLISFIWDFIPIHNFFITVLYGSTFCLGLTYVYDGVIFLVRGKSLLIGGTRKVLKHILLIGLFSSIIIEIFANWLFKTWIYPHFSTVEYLIFIIPLMSYYFFLLYENYLATVVLIEHFVKYKPRKYVNHYLYKYLFPIMGFIGVFIFITVNLVKLFSYQIPQKFGDIFNTYWYSQNNIFSYFLVFISFWMICEYLEYTRKEDTFLIHLLEGDYIPVLAIIFSSLITSIIMEFFNLPIEIWRYTNIPNDNVAFLGIPIVILAFWPFQYFLFISLYHYFYKQETQRIWD